MYYTHMNLKLHMCKFFIKEEKMKKLLLGLLTVAVASFVVGCTPACEAEKTSSKASSC